LVSPVTAEIDVSKTAYGDVAKDIAAAIRQFAYVAKTLAGARTEFANKKLLDVLIDDLGRATDDLASTVAQLEDKKQGTITKSAQMVRCPMSPNMKLKERCPQQCG